MDSAVSVWLLSSPQTAYVLLLLKYGEVLVAQPSKECGTANGGGTTTNESNLRGGGGGDDVSTGRITFAS